MGAGLDKAPGYGIGAFQRPGELLELDDIARIDRGPRFGDTTRCGGRIGDSEEAELLIEPAGDGARGQVAFNPRAGRGRGGGD